MKLLTSASPKLSTQPGPGKDRKTEDKVDIFVSDPTRPTALIIGDRQLK